MHNIALETPVTPTSFLNPAIRQVGFQEDPHQFTVAHLLI